MTKTNPLRFASSGAFGSIEGGGSRRGLKWVLRRDGRQIAVESELKTCKDFAQKYVDDLKRRKLDLPPKSKLKGNMIRWRKVHEDVHHWIGHHAKGPFTIDLEEVHDV